MIKKNKEDYLAFFIYMEQKILHGGLDSEEWDEVTWWFEEAVNLDKVFTYEELVDRFPGLFNEETL